MGPTIKDQWHFNALQWWTADFWDILFFSWSDRWPWSCYPMQSNASFFRLCQRTLLREVRCKPSQQWNSWVMNVNYKPRWMWGVCTMYIHEWPCEIFNSLSCDVQQQIHCRAGVKENNIVQKVKVNVPQSRENGSDNWTAVMWWCPLFHYRE